MAGGSVYPDAAVVRTIRDSAVTALNTAMTAPKPTYSVDGQSFKWNEYVEMLRETISWATNALKDIDASESGPGYAETLQS